MIFYVALILFFALGSVVTIGRILTMASFLRKNTRISTETMRSIPEIFELSEVELTRQLRELKTWSRVPKLSITIFIVVGVVVFVILASMETELTTNVVVTAIALAFMLGLLIMAYKRNSELKKSIGTAVTLPVLKEIFNVKAYQPDRYLWLELINSTELISTWNYMSGSDYIEGSYKGINFLFSDLRLVYKEIKSHSREKSVTKFKGQWLVCDFGKELSATLRLKERKSDDGLSISHNISKSDIETENIEFNKKYQIITKDGHTAFYLLTPHFMERLLASDKTANTQTFFCFMDGKVHIALYNRRDSFELNGLKNVDLDGVRKKFRGDLKYMTDIMDELLLNDRLFKE